MPREKGGKEGKKRNAALIDAHGYNTFLVPAIVGRKSSRGKGLRGRRRGGGGQRRNRRDFLLLLATFLPSSARHRKKKGKTASGRAGRASPSALIL